MNIINNIINIKKNISENITLVIVSKGKDNNLIKLAYNGGERNFGENYVNELKNKYLKLPKDINWHMIGNLQSNKIKDIVPFIYMIHSVNNLNKLRLIEKEASKAKKIIKCLIQIKISQDINKSGMSLREFNNILYFDFKKHFNFVKVVGIMGIASLTNDNNIIYNEYSKLYSLYIKFKKINKNIKILSMGMSLDYKIAIKCGSNMIRLGNIIFKS